MPPYAEVTDRLFAKLDELVPPPYPNDVVRIPARLNGTAFFPGGSGLYLEDRDRASIQFPVGGAMIIGHNFDSERGFERSLTNDAEDVNEGTWKHLLNLLDQAGMPRDRCFFTNAFMGLCQGGDNKKYLGRSHPEFRAACINLLRFQIAVQRPALILTLGVHVPPALASLSGDLSAWKGKPGRNSCDPAFHLKDLDAAPVISNARFEVCAGSVHSAVVTGIAHPSDQRNGRLRRPIGFAPGPGVEAEIVRSSWDLSRTMAESI